MEFEERPDGDRVYFDDREYRAVSNTIRQCGADPFAVTNLPEYRAAFDLLHRVHAETLAEVIESGVTYSNAQNVFRMKSNVNFFKASVEAIDDYLNPGASADGPQLCTVISLGRFVARKLH